MIVEDQTAVIGFLAEPANWHCGGPVERIDTHGSIVFLGRDRVLKLKRAVYFDYMDFSTLERRRRFCEAEVALNRRTAPTLYRRAVPVTRESGGNLALGGNGEPVDWVVEMARFDQDTLFDRLARDGRLTLPLVETLADSVAAFHEAAEPRPQGGSVTAWREVVASNARQFARLSGTIPVFGDGAAALCTAQKGLLANLEPLIERRREGGFVRRCHGDLHLRNICLIDGRPTLFDCIEFNDAFADIDVLYDLAFLIMDLLHRDLAVLANVVQSRYLAHGDLGGLPLLPLFLSVRAAIRSHVSATIAETLEDAAAAAGCRSEAAAYLDLAVRCLQPVPPRQVAIGGLSGSGKSTLARALAPHLGALPGAVVLRSDVIRKCLCGVAPGEPLGPAGYAPEVTARVYGEMTARAAAALAAGRSVIADAVHARAAERAAIAAVAAEAGVPFDGLWLEAPPALMAQRLTERQGDASDATVAVLERQLGYDTGTIEWQRLPAGDSGDATAAAARRRLAI